MSESPVTNALVPATSTAVAAFTPELDRIAKNIRGRVREMLILTGQDLIKAQELCPPGKWTLWLQQEFGWSQQTAYNIINVAKAFQTVGNADGISSLTIDVTAFYVLAKADVADEVRQEAVELAKSGIHVTKRVAENLVKRTPAQRRQDKQLDKSWNEDWAKSDAAAAQRLQEQSEAPEEVPVHHAPVDVVAQTVKEMKRLDHMIVIRRAEEVDDFRSDIDCEELNESLTSLAESVSCVLNENRDAEIERNNALFAGAELIGAIVERKPLSKERLVVIADNVSYGLPDEVEAFSPEEKVTWPGVLAELRDKLVPVIEGLKAKGNKQRFASKDTVAHLTDILEHALADPNYEVPTDLHLQNAQPQEPAEQAPKPKRKPRSKKAAVAEPEAEVTTPTEAQQEEAA